MRKRLAVGVLSLSVLAGMAVGLAPSGTAAPIDDARAKVFGVGPTVVTSGLNNPRQLSLVGNGQLYIAEAGSGGSTCVGEGEQESCFGATGSISQVLTPQLVSNVAPKRIVTGLFSAGGPDGSFATGADGVSAKSATELYIAVTGGDPESVPTGGGVDQAGKLLKSGYLKPKTVFADITAAEFATDPDGQGKDSNPYAVLVVGNKMLVADAAANTIFSVNSAGQVSVFKVLPNITTGACAGMPNDNGTVGCDFVPTSLALGPDGSVYVGGLGAEVPGAGNVVKLNANTGAEQYRWTNFTTITGVAVAKDGSLYVSELFVPGPTEQSFPGDLVKVAPNNARSSIPVPFPAGVAVDAQDNVYVSAFSTSPSTGLGTPFDSSGQVWRLRLASGPTPTVVVSPIG